MLQLINAQKYNSTTKQKENCNYITPSKYVSASLYIGDDKRQWVKLVYKDKKDECLYLTWASTEEVAYNLAIIQNTIKGENSMLKTVSADLKGFIAEHKSTIYTVAALFLMDHIFFQGAFRERLHGIMNKMLGKVEASLTKSDAANG